MPLPYFAGIATVTLSASDAFATTTTPAIAIRVTAVNSRPVVTLNVSVSGVEDDAVSLVGILNVTDADALSIADGLTNDFVNVTLSLPPIGDALHVAGCALAIDAAALMAAGGGVAVATDAASGSWYGGAVEWLRISGD